MKKILSIIILLFIYFTSYPQNKEIKRSIKDVKNYVADIYSYYEETETNIMDAQNAMSLQDTKLYSGYAFTSSDNLIMNCGYAKNELFEIVKDSRKIKCLDLEIESGKIEDNIFIINDASNKIYYSLSKIQYESEINGAQKHLSDARNKLEIIERELKKIQTTKLLEILKECEQFKIEK